MKTFKKQCMVALLAACMVLGSFAGAQAVDFKAKGEWLVGMQAGDGSFLKKKDHKAADTNDIFNAGQRIRLQLDAVAS
ncbi:MAG: hypothetical protein K6F46_02160, partial [Desulfovibrio sp.]|nr:hypothetical protein [Desulfovibrio sp.]